MMQLRGPSALWSDAGLVVGRSLRLLIFLMLDLSFLECLKLTFAWHRSYFLQGSSKIFRVDEDL